MNHENSHRWQTDDRNKYLSRTHLGLSSKTNNCKEINSVSVATREFLINFKRKFVSRSTQIFQRLASEKKK